MDEAKATNKIQVNLPKKGRLYKQHPPERIELLEKDCFGRQK